MQAVLQRHHRMFMTINRPSPSATEAVIAFEIGNFACSLHSTHSSIEEDPRQMIRITGGSHALPPVWYTVAGANKPAF